MEKIELGRMSKLQKILFELKYNADVERIAKPIFFTLALATAGIALYTLRDSNSIQELGRKYIEMVDKAYSHLPFYKDISK